MKTLKLPTQDELRRLFTYDPERGLLRNRIKRGTAAVGEVAGTVNSNGYRQVGSSKYLMHRLIWVYHNGQIPANRFIDHINHNRADSRIENLRLVKYSDNSKNISPQTNTRSGITGVTRLKDAPRRKQWWARIKVDGKTVSLGTFETVQEAALARESAIANFGFHRNHGKVVTPSVTSH